MLSATERKILIEIDIQEFVNAQNLSEQLNVSEKTVYRKIKKINRLFEETYGCKIIITVKGKGFIINNEFSKLELSKIINIDSTEFSITEKLTIRLIEIAPQSISINKLFQKYYLSESSATRVIKKIEEKIKINNLTLKRSSNQVWIEGLEQDLREELLQIYISLLNKNSFLTVENEELGLNRYYSIIEVVIENIENQTNAKIIEPYYTNMYVYIHILLRRYECGLVEFENNYERQSVQLVNHQINIKQLATNAIEQLRKELKIKLKPEEVDNIYILILSSRMTNTKLCVNKQIIESIAIDYMCSFFQLGAIDDNRIKLRDNLMFHIGPMLFRNENGVEFKNYLTAEIASTYPETFNKLNNISKDIEQKYHLAPISEDEVAYLSLYFEEYLLTIRQKLQVYIMCVSGIGTSNLLRKKLEKLSNDIEIKGVLSYNNLLKLNDSDSTVDLIISTVNIEKTNVQIPIVYVNPLLSADDANNILNVIKEVKGGRRDKLKRDY